MMTGNNLQPMAWVTVVAVFSMGPLLAKDGLIVAALAVVAIYIVLVDAMQTDRSAQPLSDICAFVRPVMLLSFTGMAVLANIARFCIPPVRWPYLWDALIMAWSYMHFIAAFIYLYQQ
jgi:alpha-1,3-glucosyltransferase